MGQPIISRVASGIQKLSGVRIAKQKFNNRVPFAQSVNRTRAKPTYY